MTERFNASIDGIFFFECETIEDTFEPAIAVYDIPFLDGAILENMGQKAHVIRLRCFFLNENYEAHKELIDHLRYKDNNSYELTHPEYGIIKGQVQSGIVRHDNRVDTAEVDLTFLEGLRADLVSRTASPVDSSTEEAFIAGQAELQEAIETDIVKGFGVEALELLKSLDPTQSTMFQQFRGLSAKAREYVKAADAVVGTAEGMSTAVASPANSLISTITYATHLPGRVLGAIAGTVECYAVLYNSLRPAPDRFLSSFNTGVDALMTSVVSIAGSSSYSGGSGSSSSGSARTPTPAARLATYVQIAAAQRAAVEIGATFKADEVISRPQRQAASVKTFDVLGRPQRPIDATEKTLTVSEIEQALATVRTQIQAAVDVARDMQSLKKMAAVLTDYVVETKKGRRYQATIDVDNTVPLHLVCLLHGLSYNDADQLLAINRIRHPSFVTGGMSVYVR